MIVDNDSTGTLEPINTLSTELLTLILEYAAIKENYRYDHCTPVYNRYALDAMMLVNHTFHDIARSLALRTVHLFWLRKVKGAQILDKSTWAHMAHLYHSPSSCRHLIITWHPNQVRPPWSQKLKIKRELVRKLDNVRCFQFENETDTMGLYRASHDATGYTEKYVGAWKVFADAVGRFDRLQHVVIKRARLCDVVTACGDIPRLKKLDLIELGDEDKPNKLRSKDYRSASFTTLRVYDFKATETSLRELLQWPKTLENFTWGNPRYDAWMVNRDVNIWSIPVLERLLLPHKETLKVLELGPLNFDHETPALDSWLLPLVVLLKGMSKDNWDMFFRDHGTMESYMDYYSAEGRYLGPADTDRSLT
ncbi:hypothetical protein BU23DRAFT_558934 [Bimuria novae-zelandiae CBS 107.79]|uniref:F-box domain-containing protein n=1 Tax=Bimuria novae-zelandiae CBS 107.79 TaxID=1447943 RepID=A0A6A5V3R6_9PLEO|nr:hypothetical protein BU23DRAFT_558934 [Bimuria novae-zelandiae CBS 107.79]